VVLVVLGVLREALPILRFYQKIDIFEVFYWAERKQLHFSGPDNLAI
jgi:hypothetical protein